MYRKINRFPSPEALTSDQQKGQIQVNILTKSGRTGSTSLWQRMLIGICASGLLLAGCGGGGGGGSSTACATNCDSFGQSAGAFFSGGGDSSGDAGGDGSAGDGAPIANAPVKITDSLGKSTTGTTDANGYFRLHIGGFTPPMIAEVTRPDNSIKRYSLTNQAPIVGGFITINITGLTTKVASDVAVSGGLSGVQALTPTALKTILTSNTSAISTAIADLSKSLSAQITAVGLNPTTFNPITNIFVTNGTGQDKLLDTLKIVTLPNNITYVEPVALTPLSMTKAMFNQLRINWNTAGTGINSFLDTQSTRMANDLNANISPNLTNVSGRLSAISSDMSTFEDAMAYTSLNSFGFSIAVPPSRIPSAPAIPVLMRQNGSVLSAWYGSGNYSLCWTNTGVAATVTSKLTCAHAGQNSADYANNRLKFVVIEMTGTAANQYTYTATRYNVPVTSGTSGPSIDVVGAITVATGVPTGSGTVSKTMTGTGSSAVTTSLALNGTMPPSAITTGTTPATTADTLVISMQRSALAGNNYRYAINGSVATTSATDSTKTVNLSFDTGSYFDADETNKATTGSVGVAVKLIGAAKTSATTFKGTIDLGTFVTDLDRVNSPTNVAFNGSMSDTSTGGAGQVFTGLVTVGISNYATYHSMLPDSATNYKQGTANFTGNVQSPSRQLLKLVMNMATTSQTTSDVTLTYTDLNESVTGTMTVNNASNISPVLTLLNQDNVKVVFDGQNNTGVASVAGVKQADISNGSISYIDGLTESLMTAP